MVIFPGTRLSGTGLLPVQHEAGFTVFSVGTNSDSDPAAGVSIAIRSYIVDLSKIIQTAHSNRFLELHLKI